MRRERLAAAYFLPLISSLVFLAAACGGSSAEGSKGAPPPSAIQQSAATGAPSLSGASAAGGWMTPSPTPAAIAAEPVSAITMIATDNAYVPPSFRVRAGEEVRLTLENRGQAIHDWRILNLKNAAGKDTGTSLLPAGGSETFTFTVEKPGEYTFYCEVHPVDMRGKLTVQ
jgi:plastocyanin